MGESSIAEGGGWGLIAVLEQAWNIVCFSVVNNPPDLSLPLAKFLMPLCMICEYVKILECKDSSRSPKDSSYSKRVTNLILDFGSTTHDRHEQSYIYRNANKYVRKRRLDWPQSDTLRSSVLKLLCLQNLIMEHVDHSAGDLIHLLLGLLKYNPLDRLTAPESLKHPFFTWDNYQWY